MEELIIQGIKAKKRFQFKNRKTMVSVIIYLAMDIPKQNSDITIRSMVMFHLLNFFNSLIIVAFLLNRLKFVWMFRLLNISIFFSMATYCSWKFLRILRYSYSFSSCISTPLVHPNPSWVLYSPPPDGSSISSTLYFSINFPESLKTRILFATHLFLISSASTFKR